MEGEHKKEKKISSMLFKKLERCLVKRKVVPTGCFSVYVGPEKRRFMIKIEFVNHPSFRVLLEDAESEYGFANEGPLHLPCEVDLFVKVLAKMNFDGISNEDFDEDDEPYGFSHGSCSPFSPSRRLGRISLDKGYGSYRLQTQSRFVNMTRF